MLKFLPEIFKPVIHRYEYLFFPFLAKTFHHAFDLSAHCNSFLIGFLYLDITSGNGILKKPCTFFGVYLHTCGFTHKVSRNPPVTTGNIGISWYLYGAVPAAFTPTVSFFFKLIDGDGVLFPIFCFKNELTFLDLFTM